MRTETFLLSCAEANRLAPWSHAQSDHTCEAVLVLASFCVVIYLLRTLLPAPEDGDGDDGDVLEGVDLCLIGPSNSSTLPLSLQISDSFAL